MNKITLKDLKKAVKNGMKVLHLDCETSPSLVYTHYIGSKVFIQHSQIKEEGKVMCIQYKWEGDTRTQYKAWGKNKDGWSDVMVLGKLSELVNSADIIVGQNLDNFDMKVLNARLAQMKLTPINYDVTIDVLKLSKKSFRLLSQKLDYRAKRYGGRGKRKMDFQDWIDVVEGKVSVHQKMVPYGCKDIDETQFVMYRDFDYYKKLPAKVEKVIRSFLPQQKKLCCVECEARRQKKHDIMVRAHSYRCNNCSREWSR